MRPEIKYKNTHKFSKKELEVLFLSVGWSSGEFPEKLVIAMKNYDTVFSAWNGDELVGLVCVMDDGIMNGRHSSSRVRSLRTRSERVSVSVSARVQLCLSSVFQQRRISELSVSWSSQSV